jgi:ferredoxin
MLPSNVTEIKEDEVSLKGDDGEKTIPNDVVFAMIGREPPLDFFRRSGIRISGETNAMGWTLFALFFIFCCWMYMWKGGYPGIENTTGAWPNNMPTVLSGWSGWFESQVNDRSTVIGTLAVSMKSRSFYYTLAYCLCVVGFGIDRVLRRKTPYIWVQTTVLALIQVIPLFLLPELVLPWMGYNGYFDSGFGAMAANNLFELYISQEAWAAQQWPEWGHPRAYWRAYGFILAWPLMIYNVFTKDPMMWWLAISILQTFILIPAMIFFWGKGAYCGWICSCGALAETMGDRHRHKMPHGPIWNRLNMTGQVILWIALVLLGLHIVAWTTGNPTVVGWLPHLVEGKNSEGSITWFHALTSYKWPIDVFLAGIIGVGLYFKYSGRVWCRFACPLAALMHVYARFSRFRIFADKKKCISCNVCTSVCHQGIDIMNFANKGLGMQDPECVRCSACVQSCPTGVLTFGRVGADGQPAHFDMLAASPVQMAESKNEK